MVLTGSKVLVITDHRTGGAGIVAQETASILSNNGCTIEYFWGSDYYKFSPVRYIYNRDAKYKLESLLNSYNPDVVMLHNFDNLLSPVILKGIKNYRKNNKVKVIMTLHDYHILSPTNSLTYFVKGEKRFYSNVPSITEILLNRIDKRSYFHGLLRVFQWVLYYKFQSLRNIIDHYICPSEFIFSKASQVLNSDKICLLRNPSVIIESPVEEKRNKDEITITFVGRLTEEKGIHEFLNAVVSGVYDIDSKIIIDIIGDGELRSLIQDLIDKNFNENIVINLIGRIPKDCVQKHLSNSDYVLLPSLCFENAPLSLVEGAFQGCKILTMNYGGMKEIANMQNCSFLMDNFDSESIGRLFSHVINSKDFRVNNTDILFKYSPENYFKSIEDIIKY